MGLHIINRLMGGDDIQFLSAEVATAAEKTPVAVADLCGLLCAALDTADLEAMACAKLSNAIVSKRAAVSEGKSCYWKGCLPVTACSCYMNRQ